MTKSFTVDVVPQVLSWLRISAGLRIEEVAKKLGTSVEIVKDIESGERNPTMRQMGSSSSSRNESKLPTNNHRNREDCSD